MSSIPGTNRTRVSGLAYARTVPVDRRLLVPILVTLAVWAAIAAGFTLLISDRHDWTTAALIAALWLTSVVVYGWFFNREGRLRRDVVAVLVLAGAAIVVAGAWDWLVYEPRFPNTTTGPEAATRLASAVDPLARTAARPLGEPCRPRLGWAATLGRMPFDQPG
jgi:hypothetical protein